MQSVITKEIHSGRELSPDERIVWQGAPSIWQLMLQTLHVRIFGGYFVLITLLGLINAFRRKTTLMSALQPLLPGLLTVALIGGLAWLIARSTRYIVTDRRVILRYGVALPRNLSIPFSQIASISVAMTTQSHGDIAIALHAGNHMPYLKLWPHARGWRIGAPQPMLRGIAQAGVVATQLSRQLQSLELAKQSAATQKDERKIADAVSAQPQPLEPITATAA